MQIHADDTGKRWGEPRPVWAVANCACCPAQQRFDVGLQPTDLIRGDFVEIQRAARAAGWALRVGEFCVDLCPSCAAKPRCSARKGPPRNRAIGDLLEVVMSAKR
jgi:hypothetical protein